MSLASLQNDANATSGYKLHVKVVLPDNDGKGLPTIRAVRGQLAPLAPVDGRWAGKAFRVRMPFA